ncbi:MAG: histidine kinase [Alistipes sp.]|nr:histidine kinase [Alistipes sp.]
MERKKKRGAAIVVNLLIAVVLSVVVNFSPLLSLIFNSNDASYLHNPESGVVEYDGVLHVSKDGYGYLLDAKAHATEEVIDSIYVSGRFVRLYRLQSGDEICCTTVAPNNKGGNLRVDEVVARNGQPPQSVVNDTADMIVQFVYFLLLSWLLLMIMTWRKGVTHENWHYLGRAVLVVLLSFGLYFCTPVMDWRTGEFDVMFSREGRHLADWLIILKYTVVVVATVLYGRIYLLLTQHQNIILENEHLRSENLQTRYNMLVGQINPHFFFNSLNSLSMLVREQSNDKALEYIDQLSYTFRYIIQNGQNTTTTLADEIAFAKAYGELFKVRYADKLFFDIDIDESLAEWTLPALSLQPLIGNAVKHNTITKKRPFTVSIRTEGTTLVVENRKAPKLDAEPSTGIGLQNLQSRWQLITGQDIEIVDGEEFFTVRMPLQKQSER